MEESFMKVESCGKNYYFSIMYDETREKMINLTAVDGSAVWYGEVSRADLVDQASSAEKSFDEFLMETRYAMSLENATSTKKRFSHSIEMEQTKLKFSWKLLLDHGIKFQLGSINLHKQEDKDVGSFLDAAVSQFSKMKQEISLLSKTNENLLNEREKTMKMLEDFKVAKSELESDLFGKFLLVLNEKKAKIRQLKQKCEDLKNGQGTPGTSETVSKSQEKKDESSEDDEDTDNEVEQKSQGPKNQTKHHKMPKIIGSDELDEDEVAVVSKRKREIKRRTESRAPVIPRTVSLPRPLKKEKSTSSDMSSSLDQSSENLDKLVDNL